MPTGLFYLDTQLYNLAQLQLHVHLQAASSRLPPVFVVFLVKLVCASAHYLCCCEPHFLCLSYHAQTASYNRIMYLPTITRPYLHRVMPTQIWCLSVTKPKFALSHPISAFFFLPSLVVISFNFRERTIDSSTIPYSLPVYNMLAEELER